MNQCKNSEEFFINETEDLVFANDADTKEDQEYDFDDEDEEVNEINDATSSLFSTKENFSKFYQFRR